jgi:hypothetical protein
MFFAGSLKTFQADAVAPGAADSLPDALPDALPEAVAPPVASGPASARASALPSGGAGTLGLLPAVHAGVPLPSVLQPEPAAAATASAAAIRTLRDSAVPVMVPAYSRDHAGRKGQRSRIHVS